MAGGEEISRAMQTASRGFFFAYFSPTQLR
jgi:hypothetical protein